MKRSITSQDVLELLYMLLLVRGVPEHIRSDNGPEFTSRAVRGWLLDIGVKAMFIEPGSPWEKGYVESFNRKLRDELLNRGYSAPSPEPGYQSSGGEKNITR